jgi:hypothetical protein
VIVRSEVRPWSVLDDEVKVIAVIDLSLLSVAV